MLSNIFHNIEAGNLYIAYPTGGKLIEASMPTGRAGIEHGAAARFGEYR